MPLTSFKSVPATTHAGGHHSPTKLQWQTPCVKPRHPPLLRRHPVQVVLLLLQRRQRHLLRHLHATLRHLLRHLLRRLLRRLLLQQLRRRHLPRHLLAMMRLIVTPEPSRHESRGTRGCEYCGVTSGLKGSQRANAL